ncbi:MAG: hypothetical protein A2Z51_03125 [Deltaproteobacteria bacterium RBG_19FT_COMBO_52_11]|nr:MAG: hypothetical protein A2Z51_03125 [Deltaproteobacteria bacterium RBG_19FT_COMBO_52_11]
MKIKYFSDTDTALVEFSGRKVAETKEINENIYIDMDVSGNLVAMTIEHARQQASLPSLSFEQIEKGVPNKLLQRTRVSPRR